MESNELKNIKKLVATSTVGGKSPSVEVINRCNMFVESVILDCMNSSNDFFQSYCAYASAIGISYESNPNKQAPMWVSIENGNVSLHVDSVYTVSIVDCDEQIAFILAHEVKHLLYMHLVKYMDLYLEEVSACFLNMATDVEVNESLRRELLNNDSGYASKNKMSAVPKGMFDLKVLARVLGVDVKTISSILSPAKGYSTADLAYKSLNKKCLKTLGMSIGEILYACEINRVFFVNEIFKVAFTGSSSIFKIQDGAEAVRFCKELILYLSPKIYVKGSNGNKSGKKDSDDKESGANMGKGNSKLSVDGSKSATDSGEDIQSQIKDCVEVGNKMVAAVRKGQGRSTSGGGSVSKVSYKRTKTVVPWESILNRRLKVMSEEVISTKRRINRRQPERMELSGKRTDVKLSLVVGMDESASITTEERNYFISELENIVKRYNCELHLYRFTYKIEEYQYFKTSKRFNAELLGRSRYSGGTCFQPVFEYATKNKKIPKDCLCIMFTDGYGEHTLDFGRLKNRLWVVTGNGLSCKDESLKNVFSLVDVGVSGVI